MTIGIIIMLLLAMLVVTLVLYLCNVIDRTDVIFLCILALIITIATLIYQKVEADRLKIQELELQQKIDSINTSIDTTTYKLPYIS